MALKSNFWEFNCPQYVDLQSAADDSADSYFDVDHESGQIVNISNGLFHELQKSPGLKNTGKPGKNLGCFGSTPVVLCAKRKPLSVIQNKDTNQRKDYELRLTPYREGRSKSYCSAYMLDSKESLKSANRGKCSPINKYSLRMTPARKRKAKSCFMFRDVDLEGVTKCSEICSYSDEDDDNLLNMKSQQLPENQGCETSVDSRKTYPDVVMPSEKIQSKRSASPVTETFPVKRLKLNVPQIQKPLKKHRFDQSKKSKTSEEREIMKMKQLRHEIAQQRIKNEKYMNKAIHTDFTRKASDSTMSQHTVIKPFRFKTDERIKDARPTGEYKHVEFSSLLRRQSPRVMKSKPGPTKFQPFHFATEKRKIQQDVKVDEQGPKKKTMNFGLPQSPKLKAAKRNRPITALSRQQAEELEVQEMRKYKFQAKDFDPSVFTKVSLPRVTTKPSTKPEMIELATEKRFKNKEVKKSSEEKFEFHAQPVPKQILMAPTGLKPKAAIPATEPRSPDFALKLRSQKWKEHYSIQEEPSEQQVNIFKAHPVPEFKAPAPLKSAKKCTVMEPFSFDQKDQERAHVKEQKVSEEIEKQKKACSFRAQPLPDLSGTSGIPKKETKPVTKPQPFQLHIDKLAIQKIDKWQKEIESELAQEREAVVFKAQPAIVTKRPPFQPEKSAKPLTVSNTFQLETEKRAEERAKFEEHIHTIDAENKAHLIHLEQEKKRQEKEEIVLLRKETVHKANPVRHYKPVEIKPSEKPLTEPSSPRFATNLRIKQRL